MGDMSAVGKRKWRLISLTHQRLKQEKNSAGKTPCSTTSSREKKKKTTWRRLALKFGEKKRETGIKSKTLGEEKSKKAPT